MPMVCRDEFQLRRRSKQCLLHKFGQWSIPPHKLVQLCLRYAVGLFDLTVCLESIRIFDVWAYSFPEGDLGFTHNSEPWLASA